VPLSGLAGEELPYASLWQGLFVQSPWNPELGRPHTFRFHSGHIAGNIPLVKPFTRESGYHSGAKHGRDEIGLDRSFCNRAVRIERHGLVGAGRAGRGTGGRGTIVVTAADPPSPASRP